MSDETTETAATPPHEEQEEPRPLWIQYIGGKGHYPGPRVEGK